MKKGLFFTLILIAASFIFIHPQGYAATARLDSLYDSFNDLIFDDVVAGYSYRAGFINAVTDYKNFSVTLYAGGNPYMLLGATPDADMVEDWIKGRKEDGTKITDPDNYTGRTLWDKYLDWLKSGQGNTDYAGIFERGEFQNLAAMFQFLTDSNIIMGSRDDPASLEAAGLIPYLRALFGSDFVGWDGHVAIASLLAYMTSKDRTWNRDEDGNVIDPLGDILNGPDGEAGTDDDITRSTAILAAVREFLTGQGWTEEDIAATIAEYSRITLASIRAYLSEVEDWTEVRINALFDEHREPAMLLRSEAVELFAQNGGVRETYYQYGEDGTLQYTYYYLGRSAQAVADENGQVVIGGTTYYMRTGDNADGILYATNDFTEKAEDIEHGIINGQFANITVMDGGRVTNIYQATVSRDFDGNVSYGVSTVTFHDDGLQFDGTHTGANDGQNDWAEGDFNLLGAGLLASEDREFFNPGANPTYAVVYFVNGRIREVYRASSQEDEGNITIQKGSLLFGIKPEWYDGQGRLRRLDVYGANGALGCIEMEYDAFGNLSRKMITDAIDGRPVDDERPLGTGSYDHEINYNFYIAAHNRLVYRTASYTAPGADNPTYIDTYYLFGTPLFESRPVRR